MKLNRAGAVAYARKHWNTVCDDGVFWFTNYSVNVEQKRRELKAPLHDGWEFRFLTFADGEKAVFVKGSAEKLVGQDPGIADCAHYLSRCLIKGGGADIDGARSPRLLMMQLQERADTITLVEKVARREAQAVVDSGVVKPGDMIGYFNISASGDYGGERRYTHSTMFVGHIDGAGRITCHTICRFGGETLTPKHFALTDEWHLGSDHYLYTLIHFSGDDPPLSADMAGWWSIEGRGSVQSFAKVVRRTVRATTQKPANGLQGINTKDRAHLFNEGGKLICIWQQSGKVDIWTPNKDGSFQVATAGVANRTATRMFAR